MASQGRPPKFRKMTDLFRKEILSGKYASGEKLPTDADLAVQYSLNKRTIAAGMAQLVAEGLITRTPGRGSVVVRQKPIPRKNNAVFVFADILQGSFSSIDRELSLRALRKGFYPVWAPVSLVHEAYARPNYKPMLQFVERFVNDLPYGLLIHGERFFPYDLLERNRAKFEKLVFFRDYLHTRDLPAKYVLTDYDDAAEKAVRYFAECGHRKLLFLGTRIRHPMKNGILTPQATYWNAVKKACLKYDMEFDEEIPEALWARAPVEDVIRERILGKHYTAAICPFDGAWRQFFAGPLEKAGIRMPEDLSVIGMYNTPEAAAYDTPMTSIDVNEAKMANLATEMLFSETPGEIEKIYVPTRLILRESVRKL